MVLKKRLRMGSWPCISVAWKALIVLPAGRVSFSPGITLGEAFSHVWVPAGIEVFVGWALPTKKTAFRIWSDLAGTTIDAAWKELKDERLGCLARSCSFSEILINYLHL